MEVERRLEGGAAAGRMVEFIMRDRKLEKHLRGKLLETCQLVYMGWEHLH